MFDIGLQEMVVIGVLALLVFGPSKLPELGRMIGRALREFRRASDEFRSTVEMNLHINDPDPTPPPPVTSVDPSGGETVTETPAGSPAVEAVAVEAASHPLSESAEPFCAQRGARLFHRRECSWAARIPEPDRAYFKRVTEARDQAFVACPVCEPWEPE